jgi:restriction endonuclease S subunit
MNWKPTQLSEFLTERDGRIKYEIANELGLQRIKKIDFSGTIHLDSETDTKTDMIRVKSGDLVISGINAAKGAIAVHTEEDDVLATIHYSAYEFNSDRISVEFLKWFFKSPEFSDLLREQIPGGIKTELKPKHILPLQVKLPKLSEQIEVAVRLNGFRREQMKLEHEITHQQTLLAKLKQAILQEAIQGKLTADWREANPDVEPASQLLQRIQAEKARLIAEKKLRPEKPLPKITPAEIPFEIPKGWEWCRLGSVINEKPRNGVSLKPVDYVTTAKTLKLSATSSGTFDGSQTKYLDLDVEADSYLWLRDGDILIQRANSLELVGTVAVYRGADSEFIYPDLMMKCRAVFSESTDYLHHVLSARITRDYFKSKASGSAGNMPKVNQDTVINTLIPLPPLAEQAAIVERVEGLMTTCRALEAEIEQSRTHAANLLQAVLKEAFAPASMD